MNSIGLGICEVFQACMRLMVVKNNHDWMLCGAFSVFNNVRKIHTTVYSASHPSRVRSSSTTNRDCRRPRYEIVIILSSREYKQWWDLNC